MTTRAQLKSILQNIKGPMSPDEYAERFLKQAGDVDPELLRKCSAQVKVSYCSGTPERLARALKYPPVSIR